MYAEKLKKALLYITKSQNLVNLDYPETCFKLIRRHLICNEKCGIHPMQDWTASARHGVKEKEAQKIKAYRKLP